MVLFCLRPKSQIVSVLNFAVGWFGKKLFKTNPPQTYRYSVFRLPAAGDEPGGAAVSAKGKTGHAEPVPVVNVDIAGNLGEVPFRIGPWQGLAVRLKLAAHDACHPLVAVGRQFTVQGEVSVFGGDTHKAFLSGGAGQAVEAT